MNDARGHGDVAIETASVTNGPRGAVIVSCPSPGCDWSHTEPKPAPWEIIAFLLGWRLAGRVLSRRAVRAVDALAGHLEGAAAAEQEQAK